VLGLGLLYLVIHLNVFKLKKAKIENWISYLHKGNLIVEKKIFEK